MYIKIHKSYRNVVAMCDADLIGKKFEEGKHLLDCKEDFYKDKLCSKKEAIQILQKQSNQDATFNIIGTKSIQTAIEANLITKKSIVKVQNIPFTLVLI